MNKRKALKELMEYIEKYQDIYSFHSKFIEEFGKILSKDASGHEKEVFNIMIKQLAYVKTMREDVFKADGNEILKDTGADGEYYSLHITNKTVNLRMLMRFTEEKRPLFLAVFNEKAGKKTSNYSQWISIIKKRYAELKGEEDEE